MKMRRQPLHQIRQACIAALRIDLVDVWRDVVNCQVHDGRQTYDESKSVNKGHRMSKRREEQKGKNN